MTSLPERNSSYTEDGFLELPNLSNTSIKIGRDIGNWVERLLFLDIPTIGATAAHGYCDARGIPIEPEALETLAKYGPTILHGANAFAKMSGDFANKIANGEYSRLSSRGIANVMGIFIPLGTALNAGIGALETFGGYWIGAGAGHAHNLIEKLT